MIAKVFKKFNYITISISTLSLLCISIYYSTLKFDWFSFELQILNIIIVFGSLLLISYSIDTVTRELTIERSNRNAYHLILFPLVVLSFPVESIDLRFILSSTAFFAAWRNFRLFLISTRHEKQIKRLFDTAVLLSLSSLLIFENIVLFLFPLVIILTSQIINDARFYVILIFTPLIVLPSAYIILKTLSLETLVLSSYIFGNQFPMNNEPNFSFTLNSIPFLLIIVLYLIGVFVKMMKSSGYQRKVLDIAGMLFIIAPFILISFQKYVSGSEFYYFSLILVYFIAQIFTKKINSSILNFIFISLILSIIIFNFLI